jgi:hypothetical protein
VVVLLTATGAQAARNFALKGKNELSGGFGFQAGLADWTPGGFKWFNEYNRELGRIVWLNVQLNIVFGGEYGHGGHWDTCCCDNRGRPYSCWSGGSGHWSGWAIESAFGVKLKWRLQKIPLQFHGKFGGLLAPLFWGGSEGIALGFRGGFGVRYFVVPSLGVGGEFMHDLGPAYGNNGVGWHFYATFDFNVGVEWRF